MDSQTLLQTKLYVPALPGALLPRRQLAVRLDAALPRDGGWSRRLTLVCAPAGYGKTTLAAGWATASGLPVAWYTLDDTDNNLPRFLAYLTKALEQAGLPAVEAAHEEWSGDQAAAPVLTGLLNAAAAHEPLLLVLDDYHLIRRQEVHDALTYLLDHMPPQLHLLLLTRADPPLPLARLRVRQQLVEVRQADLRFSTSEVQRLLHDLLALELPPAAVTQLADKTEGWAAGVQLAALALRGRPELLGATLPDLDSHRFVFDYLLAEVLNQQPPAYRRFLLRTSVLTRICAGLCAAILETGPDLAQDGPQFSPAEAQATLEYLEDNNLFLTALDDQRRWYRYHHLFAELLQKRLAQELPGEKRRLLRRAGKWYADQGLPAEAVRCALQADDWERVNQLAAQNVFGLVEHGHVGELAEWLRAIPAGEPETLLDFPWLLLAQGWALAYAGELPALDRQLAVLEPAGADDPRLAAHLRVLHGYLAWLKGDNDRAIAEAEAGFAQLDPGEVEARCLAATTVGNALMEEGRLSAAADWMAAGLALVPPEGVRHTNLFAATSAGTLAFTRGRLREGLAVLTDALTRAAQSRREGRPLAIECMLHTGVSNYYALQYQLPEAEAHARRGLALARQWGQVVEMLKKPCWWWTWPRPWQASQVVGPLSGAAPVPSHFWHGFAMGTEMTRGAYLERLSLMRALLRKIYICIPVNHTELKNYIYLLPTHQIILRISQT